MIFYKFELEKLLTILTFWWLKIFLNKVLIQGKLRSSLVIAQAFDIEIPGTNLSQEMRFMLGNYKICILAGFKQ